MRPGTVIKQRRAATTGGAKRSRNARRRHRRSEGRNGRHQPGRFSLRGRSGSGVWATWATCRPYTALGNRELDVDIGDSWPRWPTPVSFRYPGQAAHHPAIPQGATAALLRRTTEETETMPPQVRRHGRRPGAGDVQGRPLRRPPKADRPHSALAGQRPVEAYAMQFEEAKLGAS
jgi:hypothetical protein